MLNRWNTYLTGDADGLIVGPGLILCSNDEPRWTMGCWTGWWYSELVFFVPVFRSTPTMTSTGLAEPRFCSFVKCGWDCWRTPICWERSGGIIVLRAASRILNTYVTSYHSSDIGWKHSFNFSVNERFCNFKGCKIDYFERPLSEPTL